jgi:hypothetical protein
MTLCFERLTLHMLLEREGWASKPVFSTNHETYQILIPKYFHALKVHACVCVCVCVYVCVHTMSSKKRTVQGRGSGAWCARGCKCMDKDESGPRQSLAHEVLLCIISLYPVQLPPSSIALSP